MFNNIIKQAFLDELEKKAKRLYMKAHLSKRIGGEIKPTMSASSSEIASNALSSSPLPKLNVGIKQLLAQS